MSLEPLVEPLGFLGAAAEASAIVVVTLALTFVTLVFGELAPKRVAMQRAERWALLAVRPLNVIARLARPVIWVLGASTDLVVRVMGGDPSRRREDVTEEELRDLVASQTTFSPEQRTIISGAFEIGHRTVREILVPRGEVKVLGADQPATGTSSPSCDNPTAPSCFPADSPSTTSPTSALRFLKATMRPWPASSSTISGISPNNRGEAVRVDHWRMEVVEIRDRAITRVRIRPSDPNPPGAIIRRQPLT